MDKPLKNLLKTTQAGTTLRLWRSVVLPATRYYGYLPEFML